MSRTRSKRVPYSCNRDAFSVIEYAQKTFEVLESVEFTSELAERRKVGGASPRQ